MTQPVAPHQLLQLCARATTFPALCDRIQAASTTITDWGDIFNHAEYHGITPLLHLHLQEACIDLPRKDAITLRLIILRHRRTSATYSHLLAELIDTLNQTGIDVLVLKGGALAHTIYPEIGLRPLRDIDLLVRSTQIHEAQNLLIDQGFTASNAPRPAEHYHLPSLHKTIDNIPVSIELHHGLFPHCPPWYQPVDFDELHSHATPFMCNNVEALSPGNEDMLWHLFEHGLHMPLVYEPYKLKAVADIITLIESCTSTTNWEVLHKRHPKMMAALPMLHHLTPWRDVVLKQLDFNPGPKPSGIGLPFSGWPHQRMKEQDDRSLLDILHHTFIPPLWWSRLYYSITGYASLFRCLLWEHPRHVFWWLRLYSHLLWSTENEQRTNDSTFTYKVSMLASKIWNRRKA